MNLPTTSRQSNFTLAATGDFIGELVPSEDARVQKVWDLLRGSNFAFFNMEGNLLDLATFKGCPGSENGKDNSYGDVGGGAQYGPHQASLLAEAGFNLASQANNHAFDWLDEGMRVTQSHLSKADITVAGAGESIQSARAAAFHTHEGIEVGLVCVAGSHLPASAAGPGSSTVNPRPGISMLRAQLVTLVTPPIFSAIKTVAEAQGQTICNGVRDITLYTGQFPYAWSRWRLSPDGKPGLAWNVNEDDRQAILESIRTAHMKTPNIMFSLHAHESQSGAHDAQVPMPEDSTIPASYIQTMSRDAIEAGAACVLIHGPHHLRGIEIYHGKPIFYSLGSLTWSLGLKFRGTNLPVEWDDGMVAKITFVNLKPHTIMVYPVVHCQLDEPQTEESALPKLAPPDQASRILAMLQKLSAQFGTEISVVENVGYIYLNELEIKE